MYIQLPCILIFNVVFYKEIQTSQNLLTNNSRLMHFNRLSYITFNVYVWCKYSFVMIKPFENVVNVYI